MPLNSSGPISLGGAISGQSINLELGQAANATTSLNATNVRTLAGKPTGAVVMPLDFWGKSSSYPYLAMYQGTYITLSSNLGLFSHGRYYDSSENAFYICGNTGSTAPTSAAMITKINATTGQVIWQNIYANAMVANTSVNFSGMNQAKESGNLVLNGSINGTVSTLTTTRPFIVVISKSDGSVVRNNCPITSWTNRQHLGAYDVYYDSNSNSYMYASGSTQGTDAFNWVDQVNADTLAFIRSIRGSARGEGWGGVNFTGLNNNSNNLYYSIAKVDGASGPNVISRYNPSTATIVNQRATAGGGTYCSGQVSPDGTRVAIHIATGGSVVSTNPGALGTQFIVMFDSSLNVQWCKYVNSVNGYSILQYAMQIDNSNNSYMLFRPNALTSAQICKFDVNGNVVWITNISINSSSQMYAQIADQDSDFLYITLGLTSGTTNTTNALLKYPKGTPIYGTYTIQELTVTISNGAGTIPFVNATLNAGSSYSPTTVTSTFATLSGATNRTTGNGSLLQQLNI